jgi:hypothetical protein
MSQGLKKMTLEEIVREIAELESALYLQNVSAARNERAGAGWSGWWR